MAVQTFATASPGRLSLRGHRDTGAHFRSCSSSSCARRPGGANRLLVQCRVSAPTRTRTGEVEIGVLPVSQYNKVAKFMVENYYLDGTSGLPGAARRRLEGDQLYDLKQRYVSKGVRDAAIIVAEDGSEIAGCGAILVTPFMSNGRPDMDLGSMAMPGDSLAPVLGNLAVATDMRRKGIGKKLMAEAEEICKEWGYDELWLGVEASNKKARALYQKLGFKAKFTISEPIFKVIDGAVEETVSKNVYMRKSLRGGIIGAIENAPLPQVAAGMLVLAALAATKDNPEMLTQILDVIVLD